MDAFPEGETQRQAHHTILPAKPH